MRVFVASLAVAIVTALSGAAKAQVTVNFMENGHNNLGTTSAFSESGITVNATAYNRGSVSSDQSTTSGWRASTSRSSNDLYAKYTNGKPSETGLGLTSDKSGDHEITYGNGVLLTFSGITKTETVTITFSSVQSAGDNNPAHNDVGGVYAFDSTSKTGTLVANGVVTPSSGGDSVAVTVGPGSNAAYLITELTPSYSVTSGQWWCRTTTNYYPNVLLQSVAFSPSITTQSVPEPSTLAVGAVGALAFISYGVRRRLLKP